MVTGPREAVRVVQADRLETHGVAGLELAQLPEVRLDDGGRADKTAQRRPIRPQDHRHVAGEIHGADGVGVVVDVGGMHARLATVPTGPLRFGPDQADTGAVGVVVDLPVRAEKGLHVRFGEEFRGAMGPVGAAQGPLGGERGDHGVRQRLLPGHNRIRIQVQDIAGTQGAATVAPELTEGEGTA